MPGRANWLIDNVDRHLCKFGIIVPLRWQDILSLKEINLYAGRISRGLPQFQTHVGLTPYAPSTRNICHDILKPLPLPDETVTRIQSEDVFEHIPYQRLTAVFDEFYRVLIPGGLFRLSVPDYRNSIYVGRSMRGADGTILFDPGGGGRLVDGRVEDGGHLWFPTYELVKDLFDKSKFGSGDQVKFLHYTDSDGESILNPIDYSLGNVQRTPDHDARMNGERRALSIVVDAVKC